MTRREVLTNIVCSYIQGCGSFPKLDLEGNFNPAWYTTVEAICKKYPEEDEQEIRKTSACEDPCSVDKHYDY